MNTAFFVCIGNKNKVDIPKLLDLLCFSDSLKYKVYEPCKDVFIVLTHPESLEEKDYIFKTDTQFLFYSGNYFPDNSSLCIPGNPFASPLAIYEDNAGNGAFGTIRIFHENGVFRELVCNVDRYALHPVYYTTDKQSGCILVSNFAEALTILNRGFDIDFSAVASFFVTGLVPHNSNFIKGITRIGINEALHCRTNGGIPEISIRKSGYKYPTLIKSRDTGEHFEELYWTIRQAVRQRTKNISGPLELKLSGGIDSRLLLHCLLEDKIDFVATNYWYAFSEEPDSAIPAQLANMAGFPLKIEKSSQWETDVNELNQIGGPGKTFKQISNSKMSGSFAAVSMKKRRNVAFTFDPIVAQGISSLNYIDNINNQLALQNQMSDMAAFSVSNEIHGFNASHLYQQYAAFMCDFDEPRFSRPSNYFRGTRLLPFCDEKLLELSWIDDTVPQEASKHYLNLLKKKAPELYSIPFNSGDTYITQKKKVMSNEVKLLKYVNKLADLSHEDDFLLKYYKPALNGHIQSCDLCVRLMLWALWLKWVGKDVM